MHTDDFIKYFAKKNIEIDQRMDKRNALSSRLIRCVYKDMPLVAVGGENEKGHQINAVLDGIHWHMVKFGTKGAIRIVLGAGEHTQEILTAIATLIGSFKGDLNTHIDVNFKPQKLSRPDFSDIKKRSWLLFFQNRDKNQPPRLAIELYKRVGDESFRWYRSVTRGDWSGRVEGLEICRVGPSSNSGTLNVGNIGKKGDIGKARKLFLEIARGKESEFNFSRIDEVVEVIKKVAISRENGKLSKVQEEHHLESRILRCVVQINIGSPLKPVITDYPFQFPTLWASSGSARYLDVLMRNKDVPYAVELKVPSRGVGEKYRHAISQAVLYREFIQCAKQLHPWFNENGMDAKKCQAMVAFPKVKARQERILGKHRAVAKLFGVKIVEING